MERIVIEVDKRLAKAWKKAPAKKKKEISNKFNISLANELVALSLEETQKDSIEYIEFLDRLRKEMAAKGMTQEELDEILNDE